MPRSKASLATDTKDAKISNEVDFNSCLLRIGKNQDKAAFIQLFDYYAPRLKSFLMRGNFSPDTAEELVQETMIAVWDKAERFDPSQAAAGTWIFTIARNKKIDHLRKQKRYDIDPNDPLFVKVNSSEQIAAFDMVQERQETKLFQQALSHLPEEQRELVKLSFYESKTHQEIAGLKNLPLGTVKSRLRLALEKLRKHIKADELGYEQTASE